MMFSMVPPDASTHSAVPVCPVLMMLESAMFAVPPSTFTVAISEFDAEAPNTVALLLMTRVAPSPIRRAAPVVES